MQTILSKQYQEVVKKTNDKNYFISLTQNLNWIQRFSTRTVSLLKIHLTIVKISAIFRI